MGDFWVWGLVKTIEKYTTKKIMNLDRKEYLKRSEMGAQKIDGVIRKM